MGLQAFVVRLQVRDRILIPPQGLFGILFASKLQRLLYRKPEFQALDHKLYNRLAKWARFRHPRKSRHWIADRYWEVNPGKGWVFAAHNGLALNQYASVPIVRHAKVRNSTSPYA
jgi:hypothetical protein